MASLTAPPAPPPGTHPDGTYDTAIPGASGYLGAALLAKRAYQNALASVNQRRQSTLSQYGYKGSVDAHGQLGDFSVDAFNPYGQYQQIRRSNAMQSQDLYGQDMERGLGSGGGLAAQDQSNMRYGFGMTDKTMGQGLGDTLGGYANELTNAAYSRDAALWQAQQAAASSAADSGSFSPATEPGSPGGDGSGGDGSGIDYSQPKVGSKKAPTVQQLTSKKNFLAPAKKRIMPAKKTSGGSGRKR